MDRPQEFSVKLCNAYVKGPTKAVTCNVSTDVWNCDQSTRNSSQLMFVREKCVAGRFMQLMLQSDVYRDLLLHNLMSIYIN